MKKDLNRMSFKYWKDNGIFRMLFFHLTKHWQYNPHGSFRHHFVFRLGTCTCGVLEALRYAWRLKGIKN
jgi:hypothetical protein